MPEQTHYATCTICEATCGIAVETSSREILRVRGDEDHVLSRGHVCPKAIGMKELQEDPDRLRTPLRRTASGDYEAIGWDEAYALVTERLGAIREARGNDAVALYRGNPCIHDFSTLLGVQVLNRALGTKNVFSAGPVDTWPRYVQSGSMYGGPLRATVPDVDRTDYLLMLGANPLVSNGSLMTAPGIRDRMAAIQARGGKIVVVDPRRSETAARADEHLFIEPGGDAAFLLALIHVVFEEGRLDLGSCAGLVNGLDELEAHVARYSPERVAASCGIDAATMRRIAREVCEAPSAAIYGRMGTCVQRFGTLASWAIDLLALVTGNLDRPGGSMFPNPAAPLHPLFEAEGPVEFGRYQSRAGGRDEVLGEFPLTALVEEIETAGEGQVRGLVTIACNPARTMANSARLERALDSLEFMVSIDYYRNETTRYADLILPTTAPLERPQYDLALNHFAVHNVAVWSPAVLEPEATMLDGWTIQLELAKRLMGLGALANEQVETIVLQQFADLARGQSRFADTLTIEELVERSRPAPGPVAILDALIRLGPHGDGFGREPKGLTLERIAEHPHGLDLGALEPMLPGHLATASGKIEATPPRITSDLPRLDAWLAGAPSNELVLINRRDVRSMNSWLHNLPALAKGRDRCVLLLHPEDAANREIESGDKVRIRSNVGEIEATAQLTTDMKPGVVSLPHGFGHHGSGIALQVAGRKPGANVNAITDDEAFDEPSGASMLFGGSVEVSRL